MKLPFNYPYRTSIIDGKKNCRMCKEWISIDKFGTFKETKKIGVRIYLNSRRRSCSVKTVTEWAMKNVKKRQQWIKSKRTIWLSMVLEHYGVLCSCCGEKNKIFLTIDHINNNGRKENVRSAYFYKDIIDRNYPNDLRILCWNCNCGRQRNGGICPHQEA